METPCLFFIQIRIVPRPLFLKWIFSQWPFLRKLILGTVHTVHTAEITTFFYRGPIKNEYRGQISVILDYNKRSIIFKGCQRGTMTKLIASASNYLLQWELMEITSHLFAIMQIFNWKSLKRQKMQISNTFS
jgi:hypothetical protein